MVLPADSNKKTENATPSLEHIVGGVFHSTRNTKSPWHEICGINASLNPFTPSGVPTKKKRKERWTQFQRKYSKKMKKRKGVMK